MKSFKRPNGRPSDMPVWRRARGYLMAICHRDPVTGQEKFALRRKSPKLRGKKAIKVAKRTRQALRRAIQRAA